MDVTEIFEQINGDIIENIATDLHEVWGAENEDDVMDFALRYADDEAYIIHYEAHKWYSEIGHAVFSEIVNDMRFDCGDEILLDYSKEFSLIDLIVRAEVYLRYRYVLENASRIAKAIEQVKKAKTA